jgi:uncharacterized phiE125 gp8 family phage protein
MALASLTKLKEYLEISGSAHDTRLTDLLDRTTKAIKNFTHRELEVPGSDYTHYFDGDGVGRAVVLREYPVVGTVTSVHDDTDRAFGSGTLIDSGDYYVHTNEGIIELTNGDVFAKGVANVQVKYKAGYAAGSIPEDLEMACIYLTAHWFEERKNIALASRNLKGGGTAGHLHDLPPQVKEMLAPYVRGKVG